MDIEKMNIGSFQKKLFFILIVIFISVFLARCVSSPGLPKPCDIIPPVPRLDNSGLYMCPYTQDGVLTEWIDRMINVKMGSAGGALAGAYAGQELTKSAGGGELGKLIGETIGRSMALNACGGMDYIKQTSDISFNNLNDLVVYMYVKFSSHDHYQAALNATICIYPQLQKRYLNAIKMARTKTIKSIP